MARLAIPSMSITTYASVKVLFGIDSYLLEDPRRKPSRDPDLNKHAIPRRVALVLLLLSWIDQYIDQYVVVVALGLDSCGKSGVALLAAIGEDSQTLAQHAVNLRKRYGFF